MIQTGGQRPLTGAMMIVVAAALIAGTALLAKALGTGAEALSPVQITWGRYTFALLLLVIIATLKRPYFAPFSVPLHTARVLSGVTGVTCLFAAATLIPLADATAITFLNPIIAMVLAVFFLGEPSRRLRWLLALAAFGGALLLIRPGSTAFQPAALIALLAALLTGIEVTVLKLLSQREPNYQILLISNVGGAAIASIVVLWFWQMPTPAQWAMLVAIGVVMLSAQFLYVTALRHGDASFIVPFSYATLLFAALYDLVLFNTIPVPLSILGGIVIAVSGVALAWSEGKRSA